MVSAPAEVVASVEPKAEKVVEETPQPKKKRGFWGRLFGRGGAEATAADLGVPFLGRVPLELAIRTASDAGEPPAAGPDDRVFAPIAARVADWLAAR